MKTKGEMDWFYIMSGVVVIVFIVAMLWFSFTAGQSYRKAQEIGSSFSLDAYLDSVGDACGSNKIAVCVEGGTCYCMDSTDLDNCLTQGQMFFLIQLNHDENL